MACGDTVLFCGARWCPREFWIATHARTGDTCVRSVASQIGQTQKRATGVKSMHTCSRKSCTTPVFLTCQIAMAMSMLRRLFFGLPLWSPKGVGRFTPPHSWPWRHRFAPKVSVGFAHRADEVLGKPCGVDSSVATPLHVSVTETELRDIAKTKECSLPGVSFDRQSRSWHVQWHEEKNTSCSLQHRQAREAGDDGVCGVTHRTACSHRDAKRGRRQQIRAGRAPVLDDGGTAKNGGDEEVQGPWRPLLQGTEQVEGGVV